MSLYRRQRTAWLNIDQKNPVLADDRFHLKAVISVLAISAQFHQPATSAFLEADRFDGLLSGLPCRRYKVYKLRGNLFVSVFLYEVPCVRDAGNLSIGEML